MLGKPKLESPNPLMAENVELRARLDEAQEILHAIRSGAADALVVPGIAGEQIFTLKGADHSYRILIENMNEGALTVTAEGLILYANRCFGELLRMPLEKVIGSSILAWMAPDSQRIFQSSLRKDAEEKCRAQLILTAGDGTQVPIHLSVSHLLTDEVSASFCLVVSDLTEQKRSDAIVASEKLARELLAGANEARLALLSMIEDQKRTEKALRESEEKYRTLIENAGEAIFVVQGGKVILCNPMATRLIGYPSEEILARPFSEFIYADDRDIVVERHLKRMRGEEIPSIYSVRLVDRAGNIRWAENNVVVIDWEGQAATLNFANDITERRLAETELLEAKTLVDAVVENVPLMIFIKEATDLRFVIFNRAGEELLGYDRKELLGKNNLDLFPPEQAAHFMAKDREALAGQDMVDIPEEPVLTARKGQRLLHTRKIGVLGADGTTKYLLGISEDITERKRAEEAIQASLREKEILLREIHHRVKNNMQIISSLFNLQTEHVKDEDARRMLKEGQLRIRSMALVHEKLYQSRDLAKIDFADYLRSLSDHLFQFFRIDAGRIRLETDLEHIHLDINSAVPCGLLVSELITNALKHAFPGDRKGVVGIRLHRREDGFVEIRVADDGVGFLEAVDFCKTESLGLQIVTLLANQLEGTIELDRENGTAFTISFRELQYKPRT
jgi:PAS domain S-box-containing protein